MHALAIEYFVFNTNPDGSHPLVFTTKVLVLLEVGVGLQVLNNQGC
jgi:hypothetical protein